MLDAGLPLSSRRLLSLDAGLPNASFRLNKEIIDEVMRDAGLPDQPDEVSLPGDEVSLSSMRETCGEGDLVRAVAREGDLSCHSKVLLCISLPVNTVMVLNSACTGPLPL